MGRVDDWQAKSTPVSNREKRKREVTGLEDRQRIKWRTRSQRNPQRRSRE